ncbi:MAG: T9SS type B sorting domain-containing protein [Flavobacteriales bacterium]|nr:T9SS type B sorting domain-containing protein [Flavobacteriales bacterium]
MFFFLTNAQNTFIENKGQFPKAIISKTNLPSGALYVEKAKLTYAFYSGKQVADIHDGLASDHRVDAHAYSVSFLNANTDPNIELEEENSFFENYYLGDKLTWKSGVKSYKRQIQKSIYQGVDLYLFVNDDKLKYELYLDKLANEKAIKLRYQGLSHIKISNGNLIINTSVNSIVEYRPYAYQIIEGIEIEVACVYHLKNNILSFDFPDDYNRNYPLVIDPVLEFSTYSGSTTDNFGYTATYDDFGFLYSGSTSFGIGYPTTLGAYQLNYANSAGGTDVAITKYDTSGTIRIYSTYLGGTKDELPHSMIVNSADELFIFGTTGSADFPTTTLSYQPNFSGGPALSTLGIGVSFPDGSDIFVSRLNTNGGNLLASTFLGGSDNDGLNTAPKLKFNYADEVRGEIDIDQNNNIYIATCTQSTDFPIVGGFQNTNKGGQEGCIVKMDNQLSSVIWSSYLGENAADAIYSLALDKDDNIYVTGGTASVSFPTTSNAYQTLHQDTLKADAFISLISSNGNQVLYSSLYGSPTYDQSYFVEIGSTGAVYLFGQTKASALTLVQNATYFESGGGQFIAVFTKDLASILRATVVGTGKGTPDISPTAFLVDICDKIYLSGWGSNLGGPLSTLNLPVSFPAFQSKTDGNDFYLMVVDDALSSMIYATYFGGSQSNEHVDGGTSRFDKKGIIYQSVCAGCGGNSDFPIEPNPGAVSVTNNSPNCNNGVFKFNFDFPMVIADFNTDWVGCDTNISFQNLSTANTPINYQWNFGEGTNSTLENPNHNYSQPGNYTITLIATAPGACNVSDTIRKQVYILANSSDTITSIVKCEGDQVQIGLLPVNDPTVSYFWLPGTDLSSANVSNPFCSSPTNAIYQLLISKGNCTDTLTQNIVVPNFLLDAGEDTSYCSNPITLQASYSGGTAVLWSSNINFTDTLSLNDSLTVASIAMFYVKVSDGFCEQMDSVRVKAQSININLVGELDLCQSDSVFLLVENLMPSVAIISYLWEPSAIIYSNDSSSISSYTDSSMWYSVVAQNIDGCVLKDSVFIQVFDNPVLDSLWLTRDTIFRGESTNVNVKTDDSFIWNNLTSTANSVLVKPSQNECYAVGAFNAYDCSVTDSVCIVVLDVFCNKNGIVVPTAFSPNADQINDTYFIVDKDGVVTDFKLEIFNRLGQKVFYTEDIYKTWNGSFKGKVLNPQVFDFYLELKCLDNKTLFKKGNITLIR